MNELQSPVIAPQEIVVLHRNEQKPTSRLDKAEQLVRIASAIALPITVAIGGWIIQTTVSARSTSQEYVKLALTILTEPNNKSPRELKEWAGSLIKANSPTPFPQKTLENLIAGRIMLPAEAPYLRSSQTWFSATGKYAATVGGDGAINLFDPALGGPPKKVNDGDLVGFITAIAFSDDDAYLAAATSDGIVLIWTLPELNRHPAKLKAKSGIADVRFISDAEDGLLVSAGYPQNREWRSILWRVKDGTVFGEAASSRGNSE